jgi:RNA polymerase sigma factor (TIGR02999 family)
VSHKDLDRPPGGYTLASPRRLANRWGKGRGKSAYCCGRCAIGSDQAAGRAGDDACAATVTRLINEAGAGDPRAAASLLPLVYDQLRALARRRMRQERPDQTLQATALVHEAYLRLVDATAVQNWDGRGHFYVAAAEAMRRILVENARRRGRLKRGGGVRRVELDPAELTVDAPPDEIVALDEALAKLAERHPEKAQLVKLRYFAGLTIEEAAQALGIATSTAGRRWVFARAFLYRAMDRAEPAE